MPNDLMTEVRNLRTGAKGTDVIYDNTVIISASTSGVKGKLSKILLILEEFYEFAKVKLKRK